MKILVLDNNHPLLIDALKQSRYEVIENYSGCYEEVSNSLDDVEGIVLRSRIPIDKDLISKAPNLKFIARVGAGLENIDVEYANSKGIKVLNASEGNRDSLAEHALGMLLMLLHRLKIGDQEVRQGIWKREENRGDELMGKTVGLVGYGIQGKAFAQRLKGFDVKVICYDILPDKGDENATQVSQEILFQETDVLSLHTPLTPITRNMVNADYISKFQKNFYFINTARGASVVTKDLNDALENGKVKGACLDVLEFEQSSFENMQSADPEFQRLLTFENVIFSPHIAGWSVQSNEKLARIIVDKIQIVSER